MCGYVNSTPCTELIIVFVNLTAQKSTIVYFFQMNISATKINCEWNLSQFT